MYGLGILFQNVCSFEQTFKTQACIKDQTLEDN